MGYNMKYYWQGGRLYSDEESLSITEAYAAIPKNESIAKACRNVLIPYRETAILQDKNDEYLARLKKKRILEAAEAVKKLKESS